MPRKSILESVNQEINPITGLVEKKSTSILEGLSGKQGSTVSGKGKQVYNPVTPYNFDANNPDQEYVTNPHPNDESSQFRSALTQPLMETWGRSLKQFGANVVGAIAQSTINTTDLASTANMLTAKEKEFNSSLFGISTNDIMDWTRDVQNNNPIYEEKPGDFNPADAAWWANQVASSGTGVGMGLYALGETAAVTYLTEGAGFVPELFSQIKKVPALLKLAKNVRTAEQAMELANITRNLKRTATTYAIMNRLNESKMEAQQTFKESYAELLAMQNKDGSAKFTEQEAREYAAKGAIRDFQWNMPLMALDVLAFRTMVFNPISGKGTGLIEKGFENIASKIGVNKLGKAVAWTLPKVFGMAVEGAEEGLQYIGQEEGEHYARVLGGLDDGATFGQRLGKDVKSDEFWNNVAGGVIGSPIIGGAMHLTNKMINGRSQKRLNNLHNDFVSNVGKMDNAISTTIREYEAAGRTEEASVLRRQFGSNKALSALHLDAMKNTDTGFQSLVSFYEDTLNQINEGKIDNLQDLGFSNPTEAQIEQIKNEFNNYIEDANKMKEIYNKVSHQYNKNLVPEIAQQTFNLDRLRNEKQKLDTELVTEKGKLFQYGDLSTQGQVIFDAINDKLVADMEIARLQIKKGKANSEEEKAEIQSLIDGLKITSQEAQAKIKEANQDETYSDTVKAEDESIINSNQIGNEYVSKLSQKTQLATAIRLQRGKLSKWNNPEYQNKKLIEGVKTTNSTEKLDNTREELENKGQLNVEVAQAIQEKKEEIDAKENSKGVVNPFGNIQPLTEEDMQISQEDENKKAKAQNLSAAVTAATSPLVKEGDDFYVDDAALFEPDELKTDLTPEVAEAVRNFTADYAGSLAQELGRNPSFEDFVRDYVKTQGKQIADKQYNGLVAGWEANNFTPANYAQVYNQIFRDRKDIGKSLNDTISSMLSDAEASVVTETIIEQAVEKESKPNTFDTNNQPVYKHTSFTTHETQPKFAFISRLSEVNLTEGEANEVYVNYEYTSDELNQGQYVKSLKLLDPDKYTEGTKLKIVVPTEAQGLPDFNNVLVPIYNEDGTKAKPMTFGQYVLANNLNPSMQEYKDKVPMMIIDNEGDAVAFVHDADWYHLIRFNEDKVGQLEEAKANTKAVRAEVLENGSSNIVVTSKRNTTFEGLVLDKSKPKITVAEANPESVVAIADSLGQLKVNNKDSFEDDNNVLINSSTFEPGRIYDIRRFGKNANGQKTYIAFAVSHNAIDGKVQDTIMKVASVYLNQYNTNLDAGQKAANEKMRNDILSITKLDLYNTKDFESFIKQFIPTLSAKANSVEDVVNTANTKLKVGNPYIYMDYYGGNIIFGIVGTKLSPKNTALSLGPNIFKNGVTPQALSFVEGAFKVLQEKVIPGFKHDVSKQGLTANTPVININNNSVEVIAKDYKSYVKNNLMTNVKSYNIGTKENPNWVTNVQPIITYETESRLQEFSNKNIQEDNKDITLNPNAGVDNAELKAQLQTMMDTLSDDMYYITHITNQGNSENIFNSSLRMEAGVASTTGIVSKATLQKILQDLIDGKSPHRGYLDMFIGAIPKATLDSYAGRTLQDKLEDYISENHIEDTAKTQLPAALNFGYFTNGTLTVGKTQVENTTIEVSQEEIDRLQSEADNQLKWLGSIGDIMFEPQELTDAQVNEIVSSVTRIAGLTPSQQYHLVDFMFNQISMNVDFDSREAVSKKKISDILRQEYNSTIGPIKEDYVDRRNRLKQIYDSNPTQFSNLAATIDRYNMAINKINNIESNFDNFETQAYAKVEKYTGISETEMEEKKDTVVDVSNDDTNEQDQDFSTEALQEDGKFNSSYRLKRFFAGIRDYGKDGQPKVSFLNLPVYIGFDVVHNTLSALLAEAPADFNMMMQRLEESKDSHKWLPELINKLNNSTEQVRNEFVSTMAKHSLNMEFVMYGYDRKTGNYTLKVFNTNANSIIDHIQKEWFNNFKTSQLVTSSEGVYEINTKRAEFLLKQFDEWNSKDYEEVTNRGSLNLFKDELKSVKPGQSVLVKVAEPKLLSELQTKLANTDKLVFKHGNQDYQFTKANNGQYRISLYKPKDISAADLKTWLKDFGIEVSDDTMKEVLTKGMYNANKEGKDKLVKFHEMFHVSDNSVGLFGMLAYQLKNYIQKGTINIEEEGNNPLKDSLVKALANIESKYNTHVISNSFRDNGKSIYGFTASKYITDRVKDLKYDQDLRNNLSTLSFSKHSLWLNLMNDDNFRDKFGLSHLGLTAFKELGKPVYKDNGINSLADADHELVKLGFFMDMNQGTLNVDTAITNGIEMRIARMLSPTMSDKTTMTVIKTAVLNLKNKDLQDGNGFSNELLDVMYNQLVKPELERIVNFHNIVKQTNIKAYDKGAGMFFFLPQLNNLEIAPGITLLNHIKNTPDNNMLTWVEDNMKDEIKKVMTEVVSKLIDTKLSLWQKNGYVTLDENNNISTTKYFDSKYINNDSKFRGTVNEKVRMTAMDFVINSLIANANSFMTIAGDPANYYKEEKRTTPNTPIQKAKDTFVNVGKRLANQIAPGIKLADSENNKYIQVFIKDRTSETENLAYLTELLGEQGVADYKEIEAADAQEYTTWKEHLYILEKLGRTPDIALDITPEDIRTAREVFSTNKSLSSLSEKQKKIVNKVMQPIKPVYTGQIYDSKQDTMRVVYIKSSSFPLIPQLTQGLELDKLRVNMEKLEQHKGMTVRASYQSGNKVGAVINPVDLWDKEGKANDIATVEFEPTEDLTTASLILNRKDFRIQQDVPFKSAKRLEDTISLGTQTTKLLFGDGVLNLDGFQFEGETKTGKELYNLYNELFNDLVSEKRNKLYEQMGIDPITNQPIDIAKSLNKLQSILRDEAVNRGYPKQDIEALTLSYKRDSLGNIIDVQFTLPLWASANSNRYESLLNAIVTNRLLKLKFPGNAYVVGSEEGFKFQDDLSNVNSNKIVFTSKWTGSLKAAYRKDGSLEKGQILVPSKFRSKDGTMIDMFM